MYVVATGADPEFGRSSGPGEKSISGAFIFWRVHLQNLGFHRKNLFYF
jgi:hypothetical protein